MLESKINFVNEDLNMENSTHAFLKKDTFDTLTVQLCKTSDIKYRRAIFLEARVAGLAKDSAIHSHISSAASACSIQKIMASPTFERSGVK